MCLSKSITVKSEKLALRIKNFYFFPNFTVKLKGFELTYDRFILYFPVIFPVWNIFSKFQFASIDVSKVIT